MGALAFASSEVSQNSISHEAAAAIAIDGQIVLIDTAMARLKDRPECVVIREDGSIGIERAWNSIKWWSNRRHGYYDVDNHAGAPDGVASIPCTIIGRVISRN